MEHKNTAPPLSAEESFNILDVKPDFLLNNLIYQKTCFLQAGFLIFYGKMTNFSSGVCPHGSADKQERSTTARFSRRSSIYIE
jgi:hypothetical protein